jgi:hypothetical protein
MLLECFIALILSPLVQLLKFFFLVYFYLLFNCCFALIHKLLETIWLITGGSVATYRI